MRTVLTQKDVLSQLATAVRAFADGVGAALDASGIEVTRQHRSDIACTLVARSPTAFGSFMTAWQEGRADEALEIAAGVVEEAKQFDPALFFAAPTPQALVALQVEEMKARGLRPDVKSLTGSSTFCTMDDRRKLAYRAYWNLNAIAASNSEAA